MKPLAPPPVRAFTFAAPVTGMVFLAGGTLAVGLGDGSVRLIRLDSAPSTAWPHAADSAVLVLTADLDGRAVLTGGDDGRVARTGEDGGTMTLAEFPGRQIDVLAVSSTSGLRAIAAGREVHLLDRAARVIATAGDHPSTVSGLAFNPKGKRLAVSHYGGVTLWWVTTLGRTPTRLKWAGSHIAVTWSPDSSTVLTSMQGNELHGWRIANGRDMRMDGYPTKIRSMDWLPKPMMLVTSGADRVIGWPFTGGGPMGKPAIEIGPDAGRPVTRVTVHPTRPCVAAGFDDGRVSLCSTRDEQVTDLQTGARELIAALTWSGDGMRLAAGTDSGRIALFDCFG